MEVKAAHGVVVEVPQKAWHHDLSAMAAAITDKTRLLFVCNPNNPTGTTGHQNRSGGIDGSCA